MKGYVGGVQSRVAQLREARRLGLIVTPVRRTGEVRVSCPASCTRHDKPVTVNNRRRDGTSAVEALLQYHRHSRPTQETT